MRSPFTGVIFALELTHDVNMLTPLLLAVTIAHGFTVLTLKRSILTEKVARRGYHLSREYSVDPLEILFTREVMRENIAALPADVTAAEAAGELRTDHRDRGQLLYPIVDGEKMLRGVITRRKLEGYVAMRARWGNWRRESGGGLRAGAVARGGVSHGGDRCDAHARTAERGGSPAGGHGSLQDLLRARTRNLEEERRRERVLRIHFPFGARVR